MKKTFLFLVLIICLTSVHTNLFTNYTQQFYQASPLFHEPRFERDWLSSFDITIRGGKAGSSYNNEHNKTPLLDVYGTHNMKDLGIGVPRPNNQINNPLDQIIQNLVLLVGNENFATISIDGTSTIFELSFHFIHNFYHGFFTQLCVPFRSIQINKKQFVDLSPETNTYPNKSTPEWQRFLQFFDAILDRYGLSRNTFNETGLGDATLLFGWTHNHQDTETIDFFDVTFASGILFPTAKKDAIDIIGSVPFGYQGHWGFVTQGQCAIGLCDWITIGGHISTIFFADNTTKRRIKTAPTQSGIIKLAKTTCSVDKGPLYNIGGYVKADHFIRGFSLLCGYSFTCKQPDILCPKDTQKFNPTIINSDDMLQRWNMHTIHFFAGYDFATECSWVGPRVGFYYDYIVSGKRIFKNHLFGANTGIEILWRF